MEPHLTHLPNYVAALLWVSIGIGLCGLLALAYVYILLDQRKLKLYESFDVWMTRRASAPWQWLKSRVSTPRRLHVGLGVTALVVAALTFLMAELIESWLDGEAMFIIDDFVHRTLVQSSNPEIESALGVTTRLASVEVTLAVSLSLVALLAYRKAKHDLLALFLVMGLGELTVWGMKLAFARPRPEQSLVAAAGDAFPSGHSFTAIALYGFITYLVWGWAGRTWIRLTATAICGAIVLTVCASRLILNVHWFSDVLGGLTLGLGWLVASLLLAHSLQSTGDRS